jgi:hypothetical protein
MKAGLLATCFHAGFLSHFSTSKMEATSSSEKMVDLQWTTWCYIPEDRAPDRQKFITGTSPGIRQKHNKTELQQTLGHQKF